MKSLIKHWAINLIFIVLLSTVVISTAGCGKPVILPKTFGEVSFVQLWQMITEAIDVQEETAELGRFTIAVDENSEIMSIYLTFQARNTAGRPHVYITSIGGNGELHWSSYETDTVSATNYPSIMFAELDKVDISAVQPDSNSFYLQVYFISGSIKYNSYYTDIYHLLDGELLPLEDVMFSSNTPWAVIWLTKPWSRNYSGTVETTSSEKTSVDKTSQLWFLSRDLNRAESVKHLENQ